MLETRTFEKGLNNDAALELTPQGQYVYSLNHDIQNDGLLHGTLGNTEITNYDLALPTTGINKIIGSKENQTNNCVYYFLYNSLKQNRILRFNRSALSITTLMIEPTDPILNFSPDHLITSIDFFYLDADNLMIYFTDDNLNPPRKINEKRALGFMNRWAFQDNFFSGGSTGSFVGFVSTNALPANAPYSFTIGDRIKVVQDAGFTNPQYNNYATITSITFNASTGISRITTDLAFQQSTPPQGGYIVHEWAYSLIEEQTIDRVKWQPEFAPAVSGMKDTTYPRNNIQNNLLQFTAKYIYDDFEKSTITSYSPVMLNDEGKFNAININFNTGAPNVRKIEVCVRSKTSVDGQEVFNDTYLIKTFDKEKEGIQDNIQHLFIYYNDTILTPIPSSRPGSTVQILEPFDWVPRKLGASAGISGNRITDGDITEQFDLVKPDVLLNEISTPFTTIPLNQNIGSTFTTSLFSGIYANGNSILMYNLNNVYFLPSTIAFNNGGTVAVIGGTSPNVINVQLFGNSTVQEIVLPLTAPTLPSSVEIVLSDGTPISIPFIASDFTPSTHYPYQSINNISSQLNLHGFNTYYSPLSPNILLIQPKQKTNIFGQPISGVIIISSVHIVNRSLETAILAFKNGATHCVGIEYSDRAGRLCTVIKDDSMSIYIPFYGVNQVGTYSYLQMRINHLPPIWATHYRILYTKNTSIQKYFQIEAATNTTSVGKSIKININYFTSFNIGYSYTKGDRVRGIKHGGNYVGGPQPFFDIAIQSYNSSTFEISCKTDSPLAVSAGDIIEVYTPKLSTSQQIYYELGGKEFEVLNPYSPNRAHQGQPGGSRVYNGNTVNNDQIIANGVSAFPALVNLERGDTYFRQRAFATNYPDEIIEDANYTDAYQSAVTDVGRPNEVDDNFREVRRESTIYYSGQLITETSINGLSTVPAGSFQTYPLEHGPVMRLFTQEKILYAFQLRKIGGIQINQTLRQTSSGAVTIQNDIVLNEIDYLVGNYGLSHKESLATFGFANYGIDANRSSIWRRSNNGLTSLTQLYGLNKFTLEICDRVTMGAVPINIYGTFNRSWGQYEICFADNTNFTGATVCFGEDDNQFGGFYSYNSEGMCASANEFVSFKNGKIYLHNDNTTCTEYYGVQYPQELWVTFNEAPKVEKNQKAILQEIDDVYEMYAIDNLRGQDTNLIGADFSLLGTGYGAALWKDTNTPNVTDPLINGDEIKGFVMMGKFRHSGTNQTRIATIGCEQNLVMRSGT